MFLNICILSLIITFLNIALFFYINKETSVIHHILVKKKVSADVVFLVITFLFFLIIAVLRDPTGGLSTDYTTYHDIFNHSIMPMESYFSKFFQNDFGYLLLNKVFYLIIPNFKIFLTILHSVIITGFLYFFYKHSKIIWLSVFLLITIGSYYVSYNLIRQYFVTALFLIISCKYLFERNFFKYFLSIIILALLHKSILVMLPMYFVLNINLYSGKKSKIFYAFLFVTVIIFLNLESIISFVQNFFFTTYINGSFGTDGASISTLIRPIMILIFVLFTKKFYDFSSPKDVILFNASIIWVIIGLFSYKMVILNRFSYYFIPLVLCYIANVIHLIPKNRKYFYLFLIVFVSLLYACLTQIPVRDTLLIW